MIAWLDCASGISGDKFLSALLDAGEGDSSFTLDHVVSALRSLGLAGISVGTERVVRGGVAGLHLTTHCDEPPTHRTWADIRELISTSDVPEGARERALATFAALADAEARVHGTTPDLVHFHEVGALDSILDIVGVSIGLEALGICHLRCSPVATGGGLVGGVAHGTLPVPAPATLELLRDVPLAGGDAYGPGTGELTTPTGAALVRTNADSFGWLAGMNPARIGYGAGTREVPGISNVLRVVLGELLAPADDADPDGPATPGTPEPTDAPSRETVVLLETAVDHIAPEQVAFSAEELRSAGALDVWQVPAAMKKGRLGIELRVLAAPPDANRLATLVHDLTGSLGVRQTRMTRTVLTRESRLFAGPWGEFAAKVTGSGASLRVRPEHEEVARIARATGMAYGEVSRRLTKAAEDGDG